MTGSTTSPRLQTVEEGTTAPVEAGESIMISTSEASDMAVTLVNEEDWSHISGTAKASESEEQVNEVSDELISGISMMVQSLFLAVTTSTSVVQPF